MLPRFSVVVPAYNASATIRETLDALAAQEFLDWECVVVDDGSTDDTGRIVQEYAEADPRFRLIHQENAGCAGAYRTGVARAVADLLVICAADDFLLPRHLLVMDRMVRSHPDCGIFSSNGEYLFDETGERSTVYQSDEWADERSLAFEQVIGDCFYSVGAVFRRDVYRITGGHRPGVYVDDYDLWLRAMARGTQHCYTPDVLSVHRVSSTQQSADIVRVYESNIAAYRNLIDEGLVRSDELPLLDDAIARNERLIAEEPADRALVRQAERLRASVERIVGHRLAEPVMRLIHLFSWVVRPVRRSVLRRRLRR